MALHLIAVGTRMPGWVTEGYQEYAKRLPREFQLDLHEIPMTKRHKSADPQKCMAQEGKQMLATLPQHSHVVALDVTGKSWNTPQLAKQLDGWRQQASQISFLIGGPDGLDESCLAKAHCRWSLSPLTLPHPLVRIVLAEQLYRAWSVLAGHPYHRG